MSKYADSEMREEDSETRSESASDTQSLKNPGMFDGLTAWFSSSVDKQYIKDWEQEDGLMADVDTAQFVFSEDATAPDTVSIFLSPAYLSDSLAVFHASYIDECLQKKDIRQVTIGRFYIPPIEVQKAMGSKMRFCWQNKSSEIQPKSAKTQEKSRTKDIAVKKTCVKPISGTKIAAPLKTVSHVVPQKRPLVAEDAEPSTSRVTRQSRTSPILSSEKSPIVSLDAYIQVESLTPYTGTLIDFIPGQDGCRVLPRTKAS